MIYLLLGNQIVFFERMCRRFEVLVVLAVFVFNNSPIIICLLFYPSLKVYIKFMKKV